MFAGIVQGQHGIRKAECPLSFVEVGLDSSTGEAWVLHFGESKLSGALQDAGAGAITTGAFRKEF